MDIKQLIKSRYPKVELPSFERGEDWTYNGFDLNTQINTIH